MPYRVAFMVRMPSRLRPISVATERGVSFSFKVVYTYLIARPQKPDQLFCRGIHRAVAHIRSILREYGGVT